MPWRIINIELGLSTIVGVATANLIAGLTTIYALATQMPDWAKYILGPLGALVVTLVAVWWLARRLASIESKSEKKSDAEREMMLGILQAQVEIATKCQTALEQNTRVLERIESNQR